MNIINKIYAYTYNALLLLQNETLKREFSENIISKLDVLKLEIENKKASKKLQLEIISTLNKFIKNNKISLTPKEKIFFKDLRNYFMQIKTLLANNQTENSYQLLVNTTEEGFKKQLSYISQNSGVIKGKITSPKTGQVYYTERFKKQPNLNFFDKEYVFYFKIKRNKK